MSRPPWSGERGFTLVEMLISMLIMLGITATIFSLVDPARGTYRQQPEMADMQQRLRVGARFLSNELMMAGAGAPAAGPAEGALMNYMAPIQPLRIGWINSDLAAGVFFRDDAITIMYIPSGAPYTTISKNMPQPSSELEVEDVKGCQPGAFNAPLCGFYDGQRAIIFDETGAWDDMTITQVQPSSNHMQHNKSLPGNTLSKAYEIGAKVAMLNQRTYYLDGDTSQLMAYDGFMADTAVVDNVVDLRFEYYGDPRPPLVTDNATRATTYGPKPPKLGTSPVPAWEWGDGANCVFQLDAVTGFWAPRLPDLAVGSEALVFMDEEMLTDGPWCADSTSPTRFDADLLRVRKIGVVIRVQVASAELRGPAGALFTNAGTGLAGRTIVPDQEIRFEITPRNFNLGR